jgi:hypothetical protein
MSRALAVLLGLTIVCGASGARAEGRFLCEGTLQWVKVGDHITRVTQLCGDPDFQNERMEQRRTKRVIRAARKGVAELCEEQVSDVLVDDWVYDDGPDHYAHYLRFENGFLVNIGARWVSSR